MSTGTRQFKRIAQVVVGTGGTGLLIEKLRIQFDIIKTIRPCPNQATIKIFNLNPTHEAQLKKEFTDIILNAGYQGAMRLIFRGNIKYVYRYKQGQDWITEISAGDGDEDYANATINVSLTAGTTTQNIIDKCVASFGSTIKGSVTIPSNTHIRGRVLSGNTRHVLHRVARGNGANWSIQDGQLDIVPTAGLLPNEAVSINSTNGMLSAPEVNEKGITVKCLLNPQIKVNGAIQLDNNDIKLKVRRSKSLNTNSPKKVQTGPVRLDPDGIYKVIRAEYHGDTRGGGGSWRNDLICLALGAPIPASDIPTGEDPDAG